MGGSVPLISSVIGLIGGMQQPEGSSDRSAQIEAERKAKEEEQRQNEAKVRKREREKVTEARTIEQKRMVASSAPRTTLANGGAGLKETAAVATKQLKTTLGE